MQYRLPIDIRNNLSLHMDPQKAFTFGDELSGEYAFADPYPHIILENFLPEKLISSIYENFPTQPTKNEINYIGSYFEHNKRQILPYSCSQQALDFFYFFNSQPFLQFLEGISRIQGLIPDPYFAGAGFHETTRGGKLGIHADFRVHPELHLNRRLNVLIYLNKDWDPDWGGDLELWDTNMLAKRCSIAPIFNRCVIFNTDASSFHGHPDPLRTPIGVTRKSLALYYYTASHAIYDETPNLSTQFQARNIKEIREVENFRKKKTSLKNFVVHQLLPPLIYKSLKKYFSKNK